MLATDRAWRKQASGVLCSAAAVRFHPTSICAIPTNSSEDSATYTFNGWLFTRLWRHRTTPKGLYSGEVFTPNLDCTPRQLTISVYSCLVAYLLLADTLHAIHLRRTPNLSTGELFIKMPSTDHPFRTIYTSLIHGYALPSDAHSDEDALLLLTALLNDIIYMQQTHLSMPSPPSNQEPDTYSLRDLSSRLQNPWSPLSLQTEFRRLSADMSAALSRWHQLFGHLVRKDTGILPLYYFAKLQLLHPDLGNLFHMFVYYTRSGPVGDLAISDSTLSLAWQILESSGNASRSPQARIAIWLPIVLFSAALVVWHKIQFCADRKYGTLSVLAAFRCEIAGLPWPCCGEMARTVDRLKVGEATEAGKCA